MSLNRIVCVLSAFLFVFVANAGKTLLVDPQSIRIEYLSPHQVYLFEGASETPLLKLAGIHIVEFMFSLATSLELGVPLGIDLENMTSVPYCSDQPFEFLLFVDTRHIKKVLSLDKEWFEYHFTKDDKTFKIFERRRGELPSLAFRFDDMLFRDGFLALALNALSKCEKLREGECFRISENLYARFELKSRSQLNAELNPPLPDIPVHAPNMSMKERFVYYFLELGGFFPLGFYRSH